MEFEVGVGDVGVGVEMMEMLEMLRCTLVLDETWEPITIMSKNYSTPTWSSTRVKCKEVKHLLGASRQNREAHNNSSTSAISATH